MTYRMRNVTRRRWGIRRAPTSLPDSPARVLRRHGAAFSLDPQDGKDAETLLMNADVAMYRAKEQKGNSFQFYAPEMHSRIRERLALESNMRYALERQEFFLVYQPQIDSETNRVFGMEA